MNSTVARAGGGGWRRNINGGLMNFQEVWPDEGDVNMCAHLYTLQLRTHINQHVCPSVHTHQLTPALSLVMSDVAVLPWLLVPASTS